MQSNADHLAPAGEQLSEDEFWRKWDHPRQREQAREELFEFIYRRYYRNIYLYLNQMGEKDHYTCQDLAQNTFVKFYGAILTIRGRAWGQIKSYLATIARNELYSYWKKNCNQAQAVEFLEPTVPAAAPDDVQQLLAEIKAALAIIEPDLLRRQVVLLRLQGFSYDQIAGELDISAVNARVIYYRIISLLRIYFRK